MKNINFLLSIFVFLLIGCATDEETKVESTQVFLSAYMPEDDSDMRTTRVSLAEKQGTMSLVSKWHKDDIVQLFIKQNKKIYVLEDSPVSSVSNDGKRCVLKLTLPKEIDTEKPYTLYGFCGCKAKLEKDKIILAGSLVRKKLDALQAPVWFTASGGPKSLNVKFKHLGAYELTHFINKSQKTISAALRGYRTASGWTSASSTVKLMDGVEIDVSHPQTTASTAVSVPAGGSASIVSWYVPTGRKIEGATLLATIDGKAVESANTKSSNVAIESGKAYHLYATWNGKQLAFGKEEINEEKLSLSQSSVELKPTEEAVVEVVGGSGAYAVESSNRVVATAALSGHSLHVKALKAGNATITVTDTKSREKAALTVKVSASDDEDNPLQGHTGNAIFDQLIADMVYVAGGTFDMGATSEQEIEAYPSEKPVHSVTLSSFYLCKYEVTQELWEEVMGENPSYFKGAKLPLEYVSWEDCQAFIKTLNAKTGMKFRMPTEAEWEYAARGGRKTYHNKYAGSVKIDKVAWYYQNSESKAHEVGQLAPNELGLYDMSGNVLEWCQDWYGDYTAEAQTNPVGPAGGSSRACRGGSWNYRAVNCRVSYRNDFTPSYRNSNIGLRLAL
ncbi:SUMF1/EgtB/PvdO family nonheme iron enzyme [Prevotella sp. HUN102]|uniref:SUMF1/EgtB/PvdO family nonheme iron enzyme n=1 Tax=Prevotella sp. HUN102 TaxID=1392486 RepID=UPI00068BD5A2|nr:SUMF1/EgtB/PvdO family nonheme iron enzyme [Prevotella sp. HUN102]